MDWGVFVAVLGEKYFKIINLWGCKTAEHFIANAEQFFCYKPVPAPGKH